MNKRTVTIILSVAAIAVFAAFAINSSMNGGSGQHVMNNGQSMNGNSMDGQSMSGSTGDGGSMNMSK